MARPKSETPLWPAASWAQPKAGNPGDRVIEQRSLGRSELRFADPAVGNVAIAPKRFALRAYLALAARAGFHRRDVLLVLFWPELDTRGARKALNQALHVTGADGFERWLEGSMARDAAGHRGAARGARGMPARKSRGSATS